MILTDNIFFTSDTFFGRNAIIELQKRPFKNERDMNEAMIKSWNSKIKKTDTVFHLGNFAWDPITAKEVLDRLNFGNLYVIKGANDEAIIEIAQNYKNVLVLDYPYIEIKWRNKDLILSHYPLLEWNEMENGSFNLHGYSMKRIQNDNIKECLRINVCADVWNLGPIDMETLVEFID